MMTFKCKMCGGALEINNNETVATCEYCGTSQTLPKLDDERRANLYDRANHFRRNNEFDKAAGIYEQILNEAGTDGEAYWSLVLCRYGIEYVEDPSSHKRVPTVNRAQFTSIFDDDNYKSALEYADTYQKTIYETEAKAINEIQKGILAISQKEEPFDVFICYKETDNDGRRTPDSVLANDLYHQLTQEGFKVFFARITLEDKLGSAYEPYIFAALNSAKVMVVLGTKPEYFNAVWVKNEWSRYLSLIKNGAKKMLIPAYKDMDPYDLPEEFSHLQAQDMSKLGFMQDLIRGVSKLAKETSTVEKQQDAGMGSTKNQNALVERGFFSLEDKEWDKAKEYFDEALNQDAKLGIAYWGIHLAEAKCSTSKHYVSHRLALYQESHFLAYFACEQANEKIMEVAKQYAVDGYLSEDEIINAFEYNLKFESDVKGKDEAYREECTYLDNQVLIKRALQFSSGQTKQEIENIISQIKEKLRVQAEQSRASYDKQVADIQQSYQVFLNEKIKRIEEKSSEAKKKREHKIHSVYEESCALMQSATTALDWEGLIASFKYIKGYKDSDELIKTCEEQFAIAQEHEKHNEEIYSQAVQKMEKVVIGKVYDISNLEEAIDMFESIVGWKDVESKIAQCKRDIEKRKQEEEQANLDHIEFIKNEKKRKLQACIVIAIIGLVVAVSVLLNQFVVKPNQYESANTMMKEEKYEEAIEAFAELENYKDSKEKVVEAKYLYIQTNLDNENETTYEYLDELKEIGYKDCKTIYDELYKWTVSCVINQSEDDTETDMYEVNRRDTVHFHWILKGGYPDEEKHVSMTISSNKGWSDTADGEVKSKDQMTTSLENIEYGTSWIKIVIEGEGIQFERSVIVK